jgi:hypothetical protein
MENTQKEKIEYVALKDWKYGDKTGAYQPYTDTIYILISDPPVMERALQHERIHRSRRNQPTFKLAVLISTPGIPNLMLFALLVAGVYWFLSGVLVPLASIFSIYWITLLSRVYEEWKAEHSDKRNKPLIWNSTLGVYSESLEVKAKNENN